MVGRELVTQCSFVSFRYVPQGFQAPPEKSIAVTFHVIVPLAFWEWEESTSRMHIQFGDYSLGLWKDCGDFIKLRYVLYSKGYLHCIYIYIYI